MSKEDFNKFVERQQLAIQNAPPINWEKEREEWLDFLKMLYENINEFLKPYIQQGSIQIEYQEISLNEEHIGSYLTKVMIVKIGQQEVALTPIGTLLIGAKGRVDVTGTFGKARLVLVDETSSGPEIKVTVLREGQKLSSENQESKKPSQWVWKIASSPPRVLYIDLNQDSFFQLLMEVTNG